MSNSEFKEPKRTFPSMALTNWKDTILCWAGPRNNSNQDPIRAPGIIALKIAPFTHSVISAESFLLHLGETKYSNPFLWDGDSFVTAAGEFRTPAQTYDQNPVPFTMYRSYYFPPQEHFFVTQYHIEPKGETQGQLIEYIVSQASKNKNSKQSGEYDKESDVFVIDAADQGYFVRASVKPASSYSVAAGDSHQTLFENWGQSKLDQNTSHKGNQICICASHSFSSSIDIFVYSAIGANKDDALKAIQRARSQDPTFWIKQTASDYSAWLQKGLQPKLSGKALQLYQNSLICMKVAHNPVLGPIAASFHPHYEFKSWTRDGIFAAMALDAAGYHDEAELYLKFLSSAKLRDDGAFRTCYDWFTGKPVDFVEPQYDACGAFILASYHHYYLTKNKQFLSAVLPRITAIEDFFLKTKDFVQADFSIWEEGGSGYAYYTFTQAMAYAGLFSASQIHTILGDEKRAKLILTRAESLQNTIKERLWDKKRGFYARSVWKETGYQDPRVDASSSAVIFTGLETDKTRATSHLKMIAERLTHLDHGIARYEGDFFFFAAVYNPGGPEAGRNEPPWGVCTMFTAFAEHYMNMDISARLQWMIDYSAEGCMPVGEAIDRESGMFIMSSCPDLYEHGGVYVWGTLLKQGLTKGPNPHLYGL